MLTAITIASTAVGSMGIGVFIGWHWCRRAGAVWLVRPHTERSMARMPLPEQQPPTDSLTVSSAAWRRGKME